MNEQDASTSTTMVPTEITTALALRSAWRSAFHPTLGPRHTTGEPIAMSKATYPLKLPRSIRNAAARLAKEDGISLNQWIESAVAEKVGTVETAARFFDRRAAGHDLADLDAVLERVPDRKPRPGDELLTKLRRP